MESLTKLGTVSGHLASSRQNGRWPGVIAIHEWWGLDAQTVSIADRIAAEGYVAFAPDLFHGEHASAGDREKAAALVEEFGPAAPAGLETVFDALKAHSYCTGKVASVGFCFGGRMSLLLAMTRPLDAACTFYGGGMQRIFDRLPTIRCPVLGLFGDNDQSIPVGTVEEFDRRLDDVGVEHDIIVYPDSGHAFFRDTDLAVYRPAAAADAWSRLTGFLARHLAPAHPGGG